MTMKMPVARTELFPILSSPTSSEKHDEEYDVAHSILQYFIDRVLYEPVL